MPIYEYACDKCGHEFEREQSMSDPPVKTCPKCRSRRVTKLISRSSFVLKGGGWYSDGYSDAKAKKSESSGDTGSSGESKSDTSSTETKSADKSDTKPAKDKKKSKASGKSAA